MAEVLGKLLITTARPFCAGVDIVVVPVPLHRRRLWDRGFNQAELLARVVAQELAYPLVAPLTRRVPTRPQFNLSRRDRRANIAGAFAMKPRGREQINHKIVLLVDDIVTTGATMNECAKILKQNGAREIWGLVLAKA